MNLFERMKLKMKSKHVLIGGAFVFGAIIIVVIVFFTGTTTTPLDEEKVLIKTLEGEEETLKEQVIEAHKAVPDAYKDAFLSGNMYNSENLQRLLSWEVWRWRLMLRR